MKKNRLILVLMTVALLLPMVFTATLVQAAVPIPLFFIKEVKQDVSVTVVTKDFPPGMDWIVKMGEYNTKGVDGIAVGKFNSGKGGSFEATFDIPAELKGRQIISIRMEGTGKYFSYNWFTNDPKGTWPAKTATPAPTGTAPSTTTTPASTATTFKTPWVEAKSVEPGKTVTFVTANFPKDMDFVVLLGKIGTRGEKGIAVAELNSKEGGSFQATVDIPEALKNDQLIAIRLQSKVGKYYAYNWFDNTSPQSSTTPAPSAVATPQNPPAPKTKYPAIAVIAVEAGKSVTVRGENFPANVDFIVKMGKMWTRGIGGVESAKFNSGAGGSFEATYPIPAELANLERISIRMDGVGGWYTYNWFWNYTVEKK
ncbi:MAG: hypothetical protein ACOYKD_09900 [Anaerolineaceae bacterium]|jgi:hypothetical protein